MKKLADIDVEHFEDILDDLTYMKSKTGRKIQYHTPVNVSISRNKYSVSRVVSGAQ